MVATAEKDGKVCGLFMYIEVQVWRSVLHLVRNALGIGIYPLMAVSTWEKEVRHT